MDETKLFTDEVRFFIAQCDSSDEITHILKEDGALQFNYLTDRVTHVIADNVCPEAEEAVDLFDIPVVTSLWVHLSLRARRLLPPEAFSPFRRIFHNVVASFSHDLSRNDIYTLSITLTYYGGRVTREREESTHFIVASSKPSEFQDGKADSTRDASLKIVAPDWILDSVKQKVCCDETLYDPKLLLPPPPPPPPKEPTPPPPSPKKEQEKTMIEQNATKGQQADDNDIRNSVIRQKNHSNDGQAHTQPQIRTQSPPQNNQYLIQPNNTMQTLPPIQMTRPRMSNTTRSPQPRFRPILQNNTQPRQHVLPIPRITMTDNQQPRKVSVEYNAVQRKAGPYQLNHDLQQQSQQTQPMQPYQRAEHQQVHPPGPMLAQPNRIPPPNMYQQHVGPHYQNSHTPPRMQSNMMNPQQMQRFHDPNSQMPQTRPYQPQSQPMPSPNYQQGVQRQPVYYSQNMNNMGVRVPQQGPTMRTPMIPNEQQMINEPSQQYSNQPPPQQPVHQHQHQNQQLRISIQQQAAQPFQQPHPPVVNPQRIQFQPNMPNSHAARGQRQLVSNQQEIRASLRQSNAAQNSERIPRGPRATTAPSQPHPSIFDLNQESSYAQMKAKIPDLTENIEYFNYADGFKPPKDKPLSSCRFRLIEHEDISVGIRNEWCKIITEAGGEFVEDTDALTHIICESQTTPEFKNAIEKGIRCVTIYWIRDVLDHGHLEYPWRALHIPTAFKMSDKPLRGQIISTTNFGKVEKRDIKKMINLTGAKYTDFLSANNTILICGKAGGEKFERAIEWRVSIANCQLLSDFLISGRNFAQMLAHAKYQNFKRVDQLKLDDYVLIRSLMSPWTKPILAPTVKTPEVNGTSNITPLSSHSNEDSGVVTGSSNNSDTDTNKSQPEVSGQVNLKENEKKGTDPLTIPERRKLDESVDTTADAQEKAVESSTIMDASDLIEDAQPQTSIDITANTPGTISKNLVKSATPEKQPTARKPLLRTSRAPVRVFTTRLDAKLVDRLKSKAAQLGLGWANGPKECTHLLVDSISRSPNFVMAFSHASYILDYKWLCESHKIGQILDEKAHIIQDPEGEAKYSFNLAHSLLNRSKRPGLLFDNYIFFVTPTVITDIKEMERMIDSAGGRTETKKPASKSQIAQMKQAGKRYVIVTCREDYHLLHFVANWGIDIVRPEFVLLGILRQEVNFEAHRADIRGIAHRELVHQSNPNIPEPSPHKRLRQA